MGGNARRLIVLCLLALLCVSSYADRDQDEIKRLRDAGEILPLQTIVKQFSSQQRGGRLLEAELELREDGRYIYELKILDSDGTVRELQYDARTAEFLKVEEKY